MTLLAGEEPSGARMMRLQPIPYDRAATGNLTLTTSIQDIPGATYVVTTETDGAYWRAIGTFDINVATAGAGVLAEGRLYLDGVAQPGSALKLATVLDRATVFQQWSGILPTATSYTFTLRGIKSGAGGAISISTIHTKLGLTIQEVV